jgi:hypothetical protein
MCRLKGTGGDQLQIDKDRRNWGRQKNDVMSGYLRKLLYNDAVVANE